MAFISKLIEVRDQVKRAVDTFLACGWCHAVERDCVCGKADGQPPAMTS
ncbi:hypothetical protein [Lentzea flaviverrucosa]|uniref:Uncharacterized protein n=1 Tax=Lentzea flaviverrucosa TaxID=200379 RepID=A0A1H9XLE6_9PSEU|nr:hypothetical protein [Lentzea flaviverrucosa]RDI20338.1 hypothetical protein DFR72_115181 [Lentzea flaviverrucosa]SES46647.1 hypothetical protein SAMN05216195_115181 [Lentzea flaviverrucosa]